MKYLILSLFLVGNLVGFELEPTRKRSAARYEGDQKRFCLEDFLKYPHVPDVSFEIVRESCVQMRGMQEEQDMNFLRMIIDRVLLDSAFEDPTLKPIMQRYVTAIISLAYKEHISVTQAKDKIHKDMTILGRIIYGRAQRTSGRKWNEIQKEIAQEVASDGFQLQLKRKRNLICKK